MSNYTSIRYNSKLTLLALEASWKFSHTGKESACQCKRCGFHPWVGKIPLEEEMVTHSSVAAWKIPWTEEPGGLQSPGSQRVRHDSATEQHLLIKHVKLILIIQYIQKYHSFIIKCNIPHP